MLQVDLVVASCSAINAEKQVVCNVSEQFSEIFPLRGAVSHAAALCQVQEEGGADVKSRRSDQAAASGLLGKQRSKMLINRLETDFADGFFDYIT